MSLAFRSRAHDDDVQDLRDVMTRMAVRMTFAKGEEIYGQDEDADFVYCVTRGAVRTARVMSDGRRQVGGFYYPYEVFGLDAGHVHRFFAEALSDCEILVLKRSALRADLGQAQFERVLWAATQRELARAQDHVMILGRKSACEKVASFLAELAGRSDAKSVEMPMSRQDMADYLGLTIETVSRMLTQLQKSAVVEFAGLRSFRICNTDAMARLAE